MSSRFENLASIRSPKDFQPKCIGSLYETSSRQLKISYCQLRYFDGLLENSRAMTVHFANFSRFSKIVVAKALQNK